MKHRSRTINRHLATDARTPVRVEIWKDGKFVESSETYDKAYARLHDLQGQSWEWALRYGGWKLKPIYQD